MDGGHKKGKHMSQAEIISKIYSEVRRAYDENMGAQGEPENDIISGCLGNALDLLSYVNLEKLK
jgi:hypothetical protein